MQQTESLVLVSPRREDEGAVVQIRRQPNDYGSSRFTFRWPQSVRGAFKRPRRISVTDWCDRHFRIIGGQRPGRWRREVFPYTCTIMDAYALPFVRIIGICGPPQTGKTGLELGCLAWAIDRDPGPALMVLDQQDTAREMAKDRVLPLLKESPQLAQHLTGTADDETTKSISLRHMTLHFGWAGSVSRLANKPVKHLLLDEVDKYEHDGKREAGPVSLAMKRVRTFKHTHKCMLLSSPSTPRGEIMLCLADARVVFHYYVRCPKCGWHQVMQFTHEDGEHGIVWPEEIRDPAQIHDQMMARYRCVQCAALWTDHDRDMAVLYGEWRDPATGTEAMSWMHQHRPRHVAFHYSTLISRDVSLSEIAAKFIKADADRKRGDLEALKDFLNGYLAEPWVDGTEEGDAAAVLRLRDDRPSGLVPGGGQVACLLAAVDTQDNGFWYEIRAFGWGLSATTWSIRNGFVPSASPNDFTGLDEVMFGTVYTDAQGLIYPIQAGVIDAMGHRTSEVYDWCRLHPLFIPTKGEQRMSTPHLFRTVDSYPGTKRAIAGGLQRLHVNATHFKNLLHGLLQVAPADPGAWLYSSECTEDWARQMVSEYRDTNGLWQCPKNRANHAWDVSYNMLALADMLQIRFIPKPEDDQPAPHAAQDNGTTRRPEWWRRMAR